MGKFLACVLSCSVAGIAFGADEKKPNGAPFGLDPKGEARSTIYVVDRSAAVEKVAKTVKDELAKAVNSLDESQRFNILWFSEGDPLSFAKRFLVPADSTNKQLVEEHLKTVKFGPDADPRLALFQALDTRPDRMFLLIGDDFEPDFVDAITKKNNGKSRISVVGLKFDKPFPNLKKLAEANGGMFKEVDAKKLVAP